MKSLDVAEVEVEGRRVLIIALLAFYIYLRRSRLGKNREPAKSSNKLDKN
jgi:hypothetical protein